MKSPKSSNIQNPTTNCHSRNLNFHILIGKYVQVVLINWLITMLTLLSVLHPKMKGSKPKTNSDWVSDFRFAHLVCSKKFWDLSTCLVSFSLYFRIITIFLGQRENIIEETFGDISRVSNGPFSHSRRSWDANMVACIVLSYNPCYTLRNIETWQLEPLNISQYQENNMKTCCIYSVLRWTTL